MISEFEKLTAAEAEHLLKAPALVSVLAASADEEISAKGKADAIKLAHLKTFTADPLLLPYYREVETNFKSNFEATVSRYSPFSEPKRDQLKEEIDEVNNIIAKLDLDFASTLQKSISRYSEHVKNADRGLLVDVIFPFPIHGLTD